MALLGRLVKRALSVGTLQTNSLTPQQKQEKALKRLLSEASDTSFGKYYNFKEILKSDDIVSAYQAAIPYHDYNKIHDEWWHLMLRNVDNVTWPSKIKYYGLSSGTSGAPSKYIPESEEMLRAMRKAGTKMFYCLTKYDEINENIFFKDMLMIGGSTDLNNHGEYFSGDLSGINANRPPIWMRSKYKPGAKVAKIKDWNKRIEIIAQNAHKWDIGVVSGIPSWVQLTIERVIEHHKLDNIHQLWPNLQIFVSGGIALEPYKKSFDKLCGKPLIYMDTYLASEGFMAFQSRPETHSMSLVLNNGIFFEFIPFTDENFDEGLPKQTAKSINIDQVKTGVDYALILSSCAGAWRYLIGDTVRFTDVERAEIIITGRTKHFLSICGEHLSVDNMNTAIQRAQNHFDVRLSEYTVTAKAKEGYFTHKWYVGCDEPIDQQKLILFIDDVLKEINDDYATERKEVLKDLEIEMIPSKIFYEFLKSTGKSAGQSKFPRVLQKAQIPEWDTFLANNI
jgi:hypothetical protein